jgi:hypothetical protein
MASGAAPNPAALLSFHRGGFHVSQQRAAERIRRRRACHVEFQDGDRINCGEPSGLLLPH